MHPETLLVCHIVTTLWIVIVHKIYYDIVLKKKTILHDAFIYRTCFFEGNPNFGLGGAALFNGEFNCISCATLVTTQIYMKITSCTPGRAKK